MDEETKKTTYTTAHSKYYNKNRPIKTLQMKEYYQKNKDKLKEASRLRYQLKKASIPITA
jgi:hypothetical protein